MYSLKVVPLPAQVVDLAVRGPEEKAQGFFLKNGLTLGLSCMVFKGTKVADLNKTEPQPLLCYLVQWKVLKSTGKYWKVLESTG